MKFIKITLCLLVFLLAFTASLAISGKYLSNRSYQKVSDRLFEHQDMLEKSLITDLRRIHNIIDSNEKSSYDDVLNACDLKLEVETL